MWSIFSVVVYALSNYKQIKSISGSKLALEFWLEKLAIPSMLGHRCKLKNSTMG